MRIAIDARLMGAGNTRGIGRYIEELVRALLETSTDEVFVLLTTEKMHPFAQHPRVETVVCRVPWYGLDEQAKMAKIYQACHADVVHVPHWNVSLEWSFLQRYWRLYRKSRPRFVLTIHDLLLFHQPDSAKISTRSFIVRWFKRWMHRLVVREAVRAADVILVPTKTVMADVSHFFPEAAMKIVVTGEGMPVVEDEVDIEQTDSYLLYVGSAYPHKGLSDVLREWKKIRATFPQLRFVVAGEKDVFMQALEAKVQHERLEGVNFVGRVTEAELSSLYRGARAFVYPSTFEGFGLPPLEALAHGCPVIVRDIPVMREVLTPARVFYFESLNPDGILRSIQEVMKESWSSLHDQACRDAHMLSKRHAWTLAAQATRRSYTAL